jgi:hypothetical protein
MADALCNLGFEPCEPNDIAHKKRQFKAAYWRRSLPIGDLGTLELAAAIEHAGYATPEGGNFKPVPSFFLRVAENRVRVEPSSIANAQGHPLEYKVHKDGWQFLCCSQAELPTTIFYGNWLLTLVVRKALTGIRWPAKAAA